MANVGFDITVTDEDFGYDKVMGLLTRMGNIKVEAGIMEQDAAKLHPRTKTPIGMVALINEYGVPSKNIPARPFMLPATQAVFERHFDKIRQGLVGVLAFRVSRRLFLRQVGQDLVNEMKTNIINMSSPANAERTIERKGFDDPLRETDMMLNSISFRVSSI